MAGYKGSDEEKQKKLLDDYLHKTLSSYLTAMQKRLQHNNEGRARPWRHFVSDYTTLADLDNAHVAFTYFLNEHNKFYKEQSELLGKEDFRDLRDYYQQLRDVVFKDYFESEYRPKGGKPF